MALFIDILTKVTLPIITLVALGGLLQPKLKLDVATLDRVLVVAASTPVGVLITIFAAEYKTEAEFIFTAVVVSTALSPLFVTAWILAVRLL
jgi:predicted permease